MRKKVVIVLLGSMILPTTVWAQLSANYKPYNRKNTAGYVFDGHQLEEVLVKPYEQNGDEATRFKIEDNHKVVDALGTFSGSRVISVAKTDDDLYDDQTVYLYNPATGRFISASGTWGTEAVGLYKGFGLAFNIVSPKGDPHKYGENWGASDRWGIGFYSESSNEGHYLSRDGDKHAGEPQFTDGTTGQTVNKIRFYTDRGANDPGSGLWDDKLKCVDGNDWSWAENNHIFTWVLEKVNKPNQPNLHVYRLAQYIRNLGRDLPGTNEINVPFTQYFKHYVKLEEINPFNENPYWALTTKRANTLEWSRGNNEAHGFVGEMIDSDETFQNVDTYTNLISFDDAGITKELPEKDFYEWQIVTRRDLKEKFLLDFDDPYATKPEQGNANFNIENPDFNRPLNETIATSDAISWTEENDVYEFYKDIFGNAPYGRYAYLHPKANGALTQKFKPYQFGLFQFDIQGFRFHGPNAALPTAKLSVDTGDGTKIGHTAEVDFDELSGDDVKKLYEKIGNVARDQLSTEFRYKYQNDHQSVTTSNIFQYFDENPEKKFEDVQAGVYWLPGLVSVRGDNGSWKLNPADYGTKCLYLFNYVDDFGRVCKGIYINGQTLRPDGELGPWENGADYDYSWEVNGTGWKNGQKGKPYAEIHVNVGDKVEFGPHIGVNVDEDLRCQWWTPRGNATRNRSMTIENITYGDAGDYILTYHSETDLVNNDNKWNAVCYRLIVDTPLGFINDELTPPEVSYVKVNETGLPYAIGDGQNVSHDLVQGEKHDFEDQKDFQNAIAATDEFFVERGVGSFLYDEENETRFWKTVSLYLPESAGATLDDVTVRLSFEGISDSYKNFVAIDNARLTYRGESPYILDDNNVINTNKSFSTGNSRIPVYMNRQFDKDAWNAFVCPLPLNGQQVVDAFGANVQISEINLKGLDPNYPLRIVFDSKTFNVSDAQVIAPGHFYLVKPSALEYQSVAQVNIERDGGGNITAIDAVSYKSNDNDVIVSTDEGEKNIGKGHFTYLGTHDLRLPGADGEGTGDELAIPTKKDGDKVVVDTDAFNDYNPYGEGGKYPTSYPQGVTVKTPGVTPYSEFFAEFYPANTGKVHNSIKLVGSYLPMTFESRGNTYIFRNKDQNTQLVHLASSGGTGAPTGLKGFRFYIQDIETVSAPAGQAKPFTFVIDGVEDGNESSGISNAVIGEDTTGDIYTIAGQKVTGTLGKGVYVKNGKKFLVK